MFRPLIRPSSGACDYLLATSWVVSGSVCVGVPLQCGYGGVVSLCSLKHVVLQTALISRIYFWNKTPHVSDSSSVHHQEFFTVPHSNGICHTGLLTASCQQTCMYCCVYSEKLLMMDRGTVRNTWQFYSKNKFEKLVRLVGFIIRSPHLYKETLCSFISGRYLWDIHPLTAYPQQVLNGCIFVILSRVTVYTIPSAIALMIGHWMSE